MEQFPVVRRVYGQDRARALRLDRGAGFIIPPRSPANALDEVAAVRAAFPASVPDRGTETGLAAVLELLDSMPSVLHFAGHNAFTNEADGVPVQDVIAAVKLAMVASTADGDDPFTLNDAKITLSAARQGRGPGLKKMTDQ